MKQSNKSGFLVAHEDSWNPSCTQASEESYDLNIFDEKTINRPVFTFRKKKTITDYDYTSKSCFIKQLTFLRSFGGSENE